jgi:hypothetical protein
VEGQQETQRSCVLRPFGEVNLPRDQQTRRTRIFRDERVTVKTIDNLNSYSYEETVELPACRSIDISNEQDQRDGQNDSHHWTDHDFQK